MSKEIIKKLAKEYQAKTVENPSDRKSAIVYALLNSAIEVLEDHNTPEESRAKREKSNYPSQR